MSDAEFHRVANIVFAGSSPRMYFPSWLRLFLQRPAFPEALGALELHWQPWDGKVRFHTIEAAGVHRAQTAFFAHQR
jgi:hypothetical protein